jgi:hypothetical protein
MRWALCLVLAMLAGCGAGPDGGDTAVSTVAPEPGPLQVGLARVRMPAPVGIGTVGFGGFGVVADPSPFAEIYPATRRVHNHPDFRVIVVSRGEGFEAIFVRSDTVGVFQQFRRAIVLELEERLGRDLDDALVMGATHTHSGPGRVIDAGGPFELIADRFFPEFYERMVDAVADAVEEAYAGLAPGRVGWAFADGGTAHDDRRCEDGETYTNGDLPVLAVERDGEIAALMLAFAVHGTVLGIEELTLSQDVAGAIEQAVEDGFDHPVQVMMLNSWGADMSPGSPEVDLVEGAIQPDGYDRMEQVGAYVADAVHGVLADAAWTDEPEIDLHTYRVAIDRTILGYEDEFQYDYGAVYCSSSEEDDCDASTTQDDLDQACIPFNDEYPAPMQTEFTAGRLGDALLVTFPGEPGTKLAESVISGVETGGAPVVFLGYSQDYTGYSILEDDWWQGGYEASGALWGPRQGEHLAQAATDALTWAQGGKQPKGAPEPVEPFAETAYEPYQPTPPIGEGEVIEEVGATYGPTDTVSFVVAGSDPWLGTPVATLTDEDGTPITRPGGQPLTSDGQAFFIDLEPEPPYAEGLDLAERGFHWRFNLPVQHAVPGATPTLEGGYRVVVSLPAGAGEVQSAVFTVTRD